MKKLGGVKGFHDIVPPESERFTVIETRLRGVFAAYNYDEIRTPIAERTELFARSLGETTDIVEKEMYSFDDRDGTLAHPAAGRHGVGGTGCGRSRTRAT